MKTWVLNGDVLEVASGNLRIAADADQVYASIVEGTPAWADLPAGRCGYADRLRFSHYSVDMFALIENEPNSDRPVVSFCARTQNSVMFPISKQAATRGHVVYGQVWYPATPSANAVLLKLLEKSELASNAERPITVSGILTLKRAAAEGGPVIDNLTAEALTRLVDGGRSDQGPQGITVDLYPYQRDGWHWLCFLLREQLGGVLADEMGLGKTLQVISALRDPGGISLSGGTLVLAPGSLLENWMREIARFCPDFRALKHHGSDRTGTPTQLRNYDVVVCSYDTAIRDLSLLRMLEWNVVVLDEAQNIRNPNARRTRAVSQIKRRVGLAVTGTPIENRLRDLWSIMNFVAPGYLGDLRSFEQKYGKDRNGATRLEPIVTPLMLRRRVSEVANDLPDRIDIPEFVEFNEAEAGAYEIIREQCLLECGSAATLVSLAKLRQFCAHPAIVDDQVAMDGGSFSKFDRFKTLLEEIFSLQEKVLVFTSYLKMSDAIAAMAASVFRVPAATLDGRLAVEMRQSVIDRFSSHAGPAVLVLNPRAGGSGLNITAANHVIHYNPEWNPALQDQASARAHRRGQTRPVTVHRLVCAGSVEEVMEERLQRKREISARAVVGVEGRRKDYKDILAALERSPSTKGSDRI